MGDVVGSLRRHRRVGFDTSVFIYHIEQSAPWAEVAGRALAGLSEGRYEGVTSVLTLMELVVKPLQVGRPEAADAYETLVQRIENLTVVGIDSRVARLGADLRATYGLRTPDALQIAACIAHGASAFLTNDRRLRRVEEVEVVVLGDELDL